MTNKTLFEQTLAAVDRRINTYLKLEGESYMFARQTQTRIDELVTLRSELLKLKTETQDLAEKAEQMRQESAEALSKVTEPVNKAFHQGCVTALEALLK